MPTIGAAVLAAERDGRSGTQFHRDGFSSSSPRDFRRNKQIGKDEADQKVEMYRERAEEAELINKKYVMLLLVLVSLLFLCLPTFFILAFSTFGKARNTEATFEDLHRRITDTSNEDNQYGCTSVFPDTQGHLDTQMGEPLLLSPLIQAGRFEEAANRARVPPGIFGQVETFSGFLTSNRSSQLYFLLQVAETEPHDAPLVLWLQGGPGWSSMYGAFKETGAFYIGRTANGDTYLEANPMSWTKHFNLVFLDNPVSTGFSHSHEKQGFPTTDQQVGQLLVEALAALMELIPYLIPGATEDIPLYAFGESYGGAYVVAFAKTLMAYRDAEIAGLGDLNLVGIGIGNGFVSPEHQVLYSQYINSITFLTKHHKNTLRRREIDVLDKIKASDYSEAYASWQQMLLYIGRDVMNLTNIYDYTYVGNYLTNHEYACFLDKPHIRQALHVGATPFLNGLDSLWHMRAAVMDPIKMTWLGEVLGRLKVIVYNGNQDIIVNIAGTAAMARALKWNGKEEFERSDRRLYWVKGNRDEAKLAGYFNSGGNLTVLVVREAGHMVPISQPRVARQIALDFVNAKEDFRGSVTQPKFGDRKLTC